MFRNPQIIDGPTPINSLRPGEIFRWKVQRSRQKGACMCR